MSPLFVGGQDNITYAVVIPLVCNVILRAGRIRKRGRIRETVRRQAIVKIEVDGAKNRYGHALDIIEFVVDDNGKLSGHIVDADKLAVVLLHNILFLCS